MHLYWRVQQDLNTLGEVIQFHNPSLARCLRAWVEKNKAALARIDAGFLAGPLGVGLN